MTDKRNEKNISEKLKQKTSAKNISQKHQQKQQPKTSAKTAAVIVGQDMDKIMKIEEKANNLFIYFCIFDQLFWLIQSEMQK